MRRRRYQKGSLQRRRHDKWVWVVLYRDYSDVAAPEVRRYHTLGLASEMTKGQAEQACAEFMRDINGGGLPAGNAGAQKRPPLLREFLDQVYLPFYRAKWKPSTASTTEHRIQHHISKGLGAVQMESYTLSTLQAFLQRKADAGLSHSMVDHLRWDLRSMWELAISERVLTVNVSESLYTPKCVERKVTAAERALTLAEVYAALEHLAVRERVVVRLAVFSGMRPGEIFALRRRHVATNGRVIEIEQRVYRGKIDTPKNGKRRTISVPDATAELLEDWLMSGVSPDPEAYVFSSGVGTPLWRDNVLERWIQKPLSAEGVGLGWVNFRAFRKTNASLGHAAGVDPKVAADQRGHGIGVAMDVYTATTIKQKSAATNKLERKFQIVKTPRPKKSA